jgi:hypothetical protein
MAYVYGFIAVDAMPGINHKVYVLKNLKDLISRGSPGSIEKIFE